MQRGEACARSRPELEVREETRAAGGTGYSTVVWRVLVKRSRRKTSWWSWGRPGTRRGGGSSATGSSGSRSTRSGGTRSAGCGLVLGILREAQPRRHALETNVAQGRLDGGRHGEVADVFGTLGWVQVNGNRFTGSLAEADR
jgi:hypothetical protein